MSRSEMHDARNSAYRKLQGNKAQSKAASVPTAQMIPAQAKELGVKWEVEEVPNGQGGKLHWVGDRSSKKVILWFHGGGYGLSIFAGNIIFMVQSQRKLAVKGKDVVLAFMEYGLTPATKYPTQYVQGIQALRHILSLGYKPSDVIAGGCSAGGNLALALISIVLHPHKTIPHLALSEALKGVFLVSPWVTFSTDAPSFRENKDKDTFTAAVMSSWAEDFATPDERDNYSEPMRADAAWWKEAPVENALLVVGDHELFRDDTIAFAKTLQDADMNLKFLNCPLQVHVDCTLDAVSGLEPGVMSTSIWEWLDSLL